MTTWHEKKLIVEEMLSLRRHRLECIAYGPTGLSKMCVLCNREYDRGEAARDDCRGHAHDCLLVQIKSALRVVRELDLREEHEICPGMVEVTP